MRTVRRYIAAPLLAVVIFLPACGPQSANVTPQAAIAHYAVDIVSALNTYQAFIVKASAGETPVLPVDRAKGQMDLIRRGLTEGERLSGLLKQYDSLTGAPQSGLIPQIQSALTALATLGFDGAVLPAALVTEGTKIVSNINSLIASTRAAIAAGGL